MTGESVGDVIRILIGSILLVAVVATLGALTGLALRAVSRARRRRHDGGER